MDRYLAIGSSSWAGGGFWTWQNLLWMVVLVGVPILGPVVVRQMRKIRQPVAGTARVLSVRQFGSIAVNGPARLICRFRLRVEVPGREPYNVTHWQNVAPWHLESMGPDSTVAVDVDASRPKSVAINPGRRPQGPMSTRTVFNTTFDAPPKVVFNQTTSSAGPIDLSNLFKQNAGAGPVISAADLLASGQRAPGVLKSFSAMGTTPRSLGRTPSRPELIDAPHYMLEVELQFPNLAVTGRAIQPVPVSQVPNLAIRLRLDCAVDQADPAHRFVVDWTHL